VKSIHAKYLARGKDRGDAGEFEDLRSGVVSLVVCAIGGGIAL